MVDALLVTKRRAPPTHGQLISHPRLLRRLDLVLEKRLALVSAPAGSGKTTLVGGWTASTGVPFGWLSLDEGDDGPDRFLACLGAALENSGGNHAHRRSYRETQEVYRCRSHTYR